MKKTYRPGTPAPSPRAPGRAVLAIPALIVMLGAALPAGSEEKTLALLQKASGITAGDIERASRKKEFTLFDCFAMAVYKTERLALGGESAVQAEARKRQAVGAFLPKISLRGSAVYTPHVTPSQRTMASIYARQNLFTGLNEYYQLKSSSIDIRIREYQLRHDAGLLLLDVASAFYVFLQIRKSLDINRQILQSSSEMLGEQKRRAAIGRSRWSEVSRTSAQIRKVEAVIQALQADLESARLQLSTIAGLPADFTLAEQADFEKPDYLPGDLKKAVDRRWDVKAAIEQLESARAGARAAWGGHLPSAYVEGSYYLYQQEISGQDASSVQARDYIVSLGAELPLFSGGITAAKVKEAESIERAAGLALSRTLRFAAQDITDSYQRWENSKKEVEALKKVRESVEESNRMVMDEYRMRLVPVLDVLVSITALQSARDDYARAQFQNKLDYIRLEVATLTMPVEKIREAGGP